MDLLEVLWTPDPAVARTSAIAQFAGRTRATPTGSMSWTTGRCTPGRSRISTRSGRWQLSSWAYGSTPPLERRSVRKLCRVPNGSPGRRSTMPSTHSPTVRGVRRRPCRGVRPRGRAGKTGQPWRAARSRRQIARRPAPPRRRPRRPRRGADAQLRGGVGRVPGGREPGRDLVVVLTRLWNPCRT